MKNEKTISVILGLCTLVYTGLLIACIVSFTFRAAYGAAIITLFMASIMAFIGVYLLKNKN